MLLPPLLPVLWVCLLLLLEGFPKLLLEGFPQLLLLLLLLLLLVVEALPHQLQA